MGKKSKTGKSKSRGSRGKTAKGKTVSEDVFIKIDYPSDMRRLLLLSAKNSVIIRMLSQQVETIRRHKNEKLLELKDVLAELDQDVNELKQMMPSKNVSSLGVDIEPSRKFTHATPAPVTADDKLEQIEEMQLKKQLENELERIEGKLESL